MDLSTFNSIALAGLFAFILLNMTGLLGGNRMPVEGKTVLITGGSEGLGLAAAKKLAAKGANIILVSRSVDKLQNALQTLKTAARNPRTQRFHYISADVSIPSYAAPVIREAITWNNGRAPDIVWCVAGTSVPQLFLDMEMSSMRRQMDINYFGTADMSHAILKEWLSPDSPVENQQPRHLVMTTSAVIFYPIPGYTPYTPSKFAIRGLAESLSREVMLYPQDVRVHMVCPGTILSPGFEQEQLVKPDITKKLEQSDPRQTPEEVAEACIRGLEKGEFLITVNLLNWVMKLGCLGSAIRNNAIVDGIVAALMMLIVWPIVNIDYHGQIRRWAKKHGHPATWTTPTTNKP
ncbi:3-ketodihydrosphingosine reductase gsl-like protein [Hapsidospora chrysogenum ATCC 11550]|uniref:3-dehydrosphinganine reductase n=1 Tax=Hapsidospora chrysogenum (strain ATCC 11550 / CBS 779.69 / DSM 880 / IAM 14645 / JCM 23072 / IMI 49137) TaxID=857340 RepID=A0A086THT6_HAPC1|nr:3-ketodihydrosphingosine reductase gsl-like protein [Hapsidospora chrysogenum ATCC 11550]